MSHQISITENGTTTLATAGKYCDRNIDVNVSVPSSGTENENSIVERTIAGEYVNNEITSVGAYGFGYCESLESVTFPNVTHVYGSAFSACYSLKMVDIPNVRSIYTKAFQNCEALEKVILRGNITASLNKPDALAGTRIAEGTGYIYVPDDLVDGYKTATNWSTYADQIKPISELEA